MNRVSRLSQCLAGILLAAASVNTFAQSCLQNTQTPTGNPLTWTAQGGLSRDGGISYQSRVSPGEQVEVYVEIAPLPEHVGKQAELYLLVNRGMASDLASFSLSRPQQTFSMNAQGELVPVTSELVLQPLLTDLPLQARQRLRVFSGSLKGEEGFRLQLAYCVDDKPYFASRSISFAAEYSAAQSLQVDFPPLTSFNFTGDTLNFRGGVDSTVPYGHASVELSAPGQQTIIAPVLPGGRWEIGDAPVGDSMTLSLKVHGQLVDVKQYRINREDSWIDVEGFALDTKRRIAYVTDRARRQIFTVNLDTGVRTLLRSAAMPAFSGALLSDIAVGADTGKLFVTGQGSALISEISSDGTGSVGLHAITLVRASVTGTRLPVGSNFKSIEYSKTHNTLFVADILSGQVYAYDLQTGQSRLLAQVTNPMPLPNPGPVGFPTGVASIVALTDIAVDEANNRILAISLLGHRIWAIDIASGLVTEIFDQASATVTGVSPRPIDPGAGQPAGIASSGYLALSHDSKRDLWIVAGLGELLAVDLRANTITQVANTAASADPVLYATDLAYDDVADRYVVIDGVRNTLHSHDPVTHQTARLSGSAFNGSNLGTTGDMSLVPGSRSRTLVVTNPFVSSLNVLNFRDDAWSFSNVGLTMPVVGVIPSTPIGTSVIVRDAVLPGSPLAYDAIRDRHVLLASTTGGTLGIRGIPAGQILNDPAGGGATRILALDLSQPLQTWTPFTELKPSYAGDAADLANLSHVAIKPDGAQYLLGNIHGDIFSLNPATLVLTRVPTQRTPIPPSALAFAGDTLLQLGTSGELSSIDLDARSANYGKSRIVSAQSRGAGPSIGVPGGMAVANNQNLLYVSSATAAAVLGVDLVSGDRRELSGSQRGEGGALLQPGDVVQLYDARTLYVEDASRLVIIDLDTGDRIVME